jgi:LPS sulfotransferase NodH
MSGTGGGDGKVERGSWEILGDAVSWRLCLLEGKALCADARRRTGLEDFGDPPIEPALSVLVNSLEREAVLHPLGRFLMRAHLRSLLETRLQLAEAWGGQLEALEASPIQRPVFITGMPRSGSTFLHELLAEDPDNRAPRVWEVMFPVPIPGVERRRRDPRVRKAAASLWWFRRIVPQADAVYPVRACTPHECVAIHSFTLLSEEFVSTCRVPTYEAFLRSAGLGPAYAWQKRFLQHLQRRCPAKRWVLKSPDHAYGLEELFSVFPDAVIVQTHRDPLEVLRSSSQLISVLRGLFARPGDPDQIAAREARVLADAMERFIRFRDLHPELAGRFLDVQYSDLASDPLAAVRRIYQHLGTPLTDMATGRMRHLVSNRSRHRGHRTNRTLADLGFDVPAEVRRFSRYSLRFGVPCQQAEF